MGVRDVHITATQHSTHIIVVHTGIHFSAESLVAFWMFNLAHGLSTVWWTLPVHPLREWDQVPIGMSPKACFNRSLSGHNCTRD